MLILYSDGDLIREFIAEEVAMDSFFLPYGRQSIDQSDAAAVAAALQQPLITRGPLTEQFEEELALYCGANYAVLFNSATSALHAAYFAGELSAADRILLPTNTFVATGNYGFQRGARLLLIDIEETSGNISLDELQANLGEPPSTRGKEFVVPVHFGGVAVDMRKLAGMVRSPATLVIEDAAHALGSIYPSGEKVGCCSYSDMTIFSFHPLKTITTGEGGAVTCNCPKLRDRLRLFRNNGIVRDPRHWAEQPWYYEVVAPAGNYHMTEFQAALGSSQLKRIDLFIEQRRSCVELYRQLLAPVQLVSLLDASHPERTAPHLFIVQIDFEQLQGGRGKLMEQLAEQHIGTQVHYIPLYRHPLFKEQMGDLSSYFPGSERYYARALSLPLYADLTLEQVELVVEKLVASLQQLRQRG